MTVSSACVSMLRLSMTPGLGPVLTSRAIADLGSAEAVLGANEHALKRVRGIGAEKARTICAGLAASSALADAELELAARLGVSLVAIGEEAYPALLAQIPNPPLVLYCRGALEPSGRDRYGVAIVGSRECSTYGLEQSARFSSALAQAGVCVVSGGARGIDTSAHRAALQAKGRTVAVLGCGLAHNYPPENARLFSEIVEQDAGCIVSELPLNTPPSAENFPARNRIICGLSLGVLVVEAAKRSGALITARVALEEQNREVFAIPGRLDSPYSAGSLEILKSGGAGLVTHPDDVLQALESRARHHHAGTHGALFGVSGGDEQLNDGGNEEGGDALFSQARTEQPRTPRGGASKTAAGNGVTGNGSSANGEEAEAAAHELDRSLSAQQRAILATLDRALTLDELLVQMGGDAAQVRAEISMLEIKRRVRRSGSRYERVR